MNRHVRPVEVEEQDCGVEVIDNLGELLSVLPDRLRSRLMRLGSLAELIEIVCDLGRVPEARFTSKLAPIDERPISREDLVQMEQGVGEFGRDNRAGIERTLHRISALRNRRGEVVGLTFRVGRAVYGTVDVVRDVIEAGRSVLLVGRPGVGKTTLLREAARVLADDFGKRVIIVDTSNEIAGDGDIPHPGIGRARRMHVPAPELQHAVMIEAVENHMPEVVVIDEIGTEQEALAARTIAERGVQLIATAHGNTLENLVVNPTLADLIGGIQTVTLGDEEARRRRTQKTVLERKAPPTFGVAIEIRDKDCFAVHHDVAGVVDALLRHAHVEPEVRMRSDNGEYEIIAEATSVVLEPTTTRAPRRMRIFPHGLNRERLENQMRGLGINAVTVDRPETADIVLILRTLARKQERNLRELSRKGVQIRVIASNNPNKIERALREIFELEDQTAPAQDAMREVEDAIAEVIRDRRAIELAPQASAVRRLQHELAEARGVSSQSVGRDPFRHLVLRPPRRDR